MIHLLPPQPFFVRAKTKGIPTIADDRIFFFSPRSIDEDMKPPMVLPGLMLEGKDCVEHIADENMPTHCPSCNSALEYQVVSHTWDWMQGCFYCPDHRLEVWIDYYPKNNQGTTQDRLNAFEVRAYGVNLAMKDVDAGRRAFIVNEDEIQSGLSRRKAEAPLLYTLTPSGLIKIPLSFPKSVFAYWRQQLA